MARKKVEKIKVRSEDDIMDAESGDYCYFLNPSNKVVFAEIKKVFDENGIRVLQIISQDEFKFMSLPAAICSFDERSLKGKKRAQLCPEVYSV